MAKTTTKTATKTPTAKGGKRKKLSKAEKAIQLGEQALAFYKAKTKAAKLEAIHKKANPIVKDLANDLRIRYVEIPGVNDKQLDVRPSTDTTVDTEAIIAHVKEHAPKLLDTIYPKVPATRRYDHAAFEAAVKQGKVPDAENLLAKVIDTQPGTPALYIIDKD